MALIALASAHGAPGVTTAALAMTLQWPRQALLAECDVSGGSSILAGYHEAKYPHDRGVVPLLHAHRQGELREQLWNQTMPLTKDGGDGRVISAEGKGLLPGIRDSAHAAAVESLWEPLAAEFRWLDSAGIDVIADVGRLGMAHSAQPLLAHADLVLLVIGPGMPAKNSARTRSALLRRQIGQSGITDPLRLLLQKDEAFAAHEVAAALDVPVLATLAYDPTAAAVLSDGKRPSKSFQASPLMNTARAAVSQSWAHVEDRRQLVRGPVAVTSVVDVREENSHV